MGDRAAERHGDLLREINQEQAAALLRISRTLEGLIDRLAEMRTRYASVPEAGRAAFRREYLEVREQARTYRWYLEVQRESVGLGHHASLDRFYMIPGELDVPEAAPDDARPASTS